MQELVRRLLIRRSDTDQKDKLLLDADRDLQNEREGDDEHENVRRYIERSLDDSVGVKDHAIDWRRWSDLPVHAEWATFAEIRKLACHPTNRSIDSEYLNCYLLLQPHCETTVQFQCTDFKDPDHV